MVRHINGSPGKAHGIIIAPYNSSQKSNADIILDGEYDDEIINDTVDSLSSGGNLFLLDGDINLVAEQKVLLRDDITIKGCRFATVFKVSENAIGITQHADAGTLYGVKLKDFMVQGDELIVPTTTSVGIKLSPQESEFTGLRVIGCKDGMDLVGGFDNALSIMNFISKCYFLSNRSKGIKVGTDSIITQCLVGDNGNPETETVDYDSCGIHAVGWGSNIENNHIYKNNYGIRNEWAVGNIMSNNIFESGYREDILFAGRAHACKVTGNSFLGKDRMAPYDWSEFNCITFVGAPAGEGAQRNSITGNTLAYYVTEVLPKTHYNYFVEECENCDYNTMAYNTLNGYYKQTNPILKVGASTVITPNS